MPQRVLPAPPDSSAPTYAALPKADFQLIYVVHGDASYSYHDSSGHRNLADEETVKQALEVAQASTKGEVFIFHQKQVPRFFSRSPDGVFYHYRCGERIHKEEYSRRESGMDFGAETSLFRRYQSDVPAKFFAYYGHEIPEKELKGYSASYPNRTFSQAEFARGLRGFARPDSVGSKPFALIVLSTCHGGTPAMLEALSPFADHVIASPGNLHLSFFDTHAFRDLSGGVWTPLGKAGVLNLAEIISRDSFKRLQAMTQTEITVATYDLEKGSAVPDGLGNPSPCGIKDGVDLLYRAPRFGIRKVASTSAGWEGLTRPELNGPCAP